MALKNVKTNSVPAVSLLDAAKQELARRQGLAGLNELAHTTGVQPVNRSVTQRRVGPRGSEYPYDPGPAYIVEISAKGRRLYNEWRVQQLSAADGGN